LQKSFPEEKGDPSRELFLPKVEFIECPIKTSLGVLGKKWTMLILRDIGFRRIDRFNELLKSVPGLTPRVLSMRLKELEEDGYIECIENQKSPMIVRWTLTQKGSETLPILMRFIAFGSKWHADEVFEDKIPRTLTELFNPGAIKIMRGYEENSVGSRVYRES
jgi:DNA-binding HxlR family transcriptional regulator